VTFMEWLRENAGHLAAYIGWILVAIEAVAVVTVWILRPSSRLLGRASRFKKTFRSFTVWLLPLPLVVLVIALGPMSPLFSSARKLARQSGEMLPDVVFRSVDRREHRLSELRGRVIVLNIWATWCAPCRQELPTLSELQRRCGGRGLTVVTLSDQQPEQIVDFLNQYAPNTLNGVVDSFDWLPVRTFRPFTLIIGRDGKLRDYFFGAQELAAFERRLRPIL
jgi:cytochrome c biogenesis protein CcmG, thiol:disulfide interchange protein DsbE